MEEAAPGAFVVSVMESEAISMRKVEEWLFWNLEQCIFQTKIEYIHLSLSSNFPFIFSLSLFYSKINTPPHLRGRRGFYERQPRLH